MAFQDRSLIFFCYINRNTLVECRSFKNKKKVQPAAAHSGTVRKHTDQASTSISSCFRICSRHAQVHRHSCRWLSETAGMPRRPAAPAQDASDFCRATMLAPPICVAAEGFRHFGDQPATTAGERGRRLHHGRPRPRRDDDGLPRRPCRPSPWLQLQAGLLRLGL